MHATAIGLIIPAAAVAHASIVTVGLVIDDRADGDPITRAPDLEGNVFGPPASKVLFPDDLGRIAGRFCDGDPAVIPVDAQPLASRDALGPREARSFASLELLSGER